MPKMAFSVRDAFARVVSLSIGRGARYSQPVACSAHVYNNVIGCSSLRFCCDCLGHEAPPVLGAFTESLSGVYDGGDIGSGTMEMPPPPLPSAELFHGSYSVQHGNQPRRCTVLISWCIHPVTCVVSVVSLSLNFSLITKTAFLVLLFTDPCLSILFETLSLT